MLSRLAQVNDLNGHALYDMLQVNPKANLADLKKVQACCLELACLLCVIESTGDNCSLAVQAYRLLAKKHHPDRGGRADDFARIQQAFEVLSDPQQREVYDTWAKQLQFRYVRGVAAQVSSAAASI